jgi:hypothetical protein
MEGQGGAHGAVGVEKGEGKEKEADDNGVDPFYSGAVGGGRGGGPGGEGRHTVIEGGGRRQTAAGGPELTGMSDIGQRVV